MFATQLLCLRFRHTGGLRLLSGSVVHLDVEDCSEELLWCLLCHKEPARRNQSLHLGACGIFLLAPRWFLMEKECWHSNSSEQSSTLKWTSLNYTG